MAVTPVINRSMFPLSSGINNIMNMKERYDVLQTQLASGQKASRLSEMGSDRYFDLALRQRISRIDSYQDSIKSVDLRINVLDQTISRLDIIEADMRAVTLSGSGGQSSLNFETAPAVAAASFDEVLTLLNADVAGRYLFGGKETEDRPVEDSFTVLNGIGGRDGFMKVVEQRRIADLGAGNMGRLTVTPPVANVVTLTEDGLADMPFGIKLSTVTGSANVTVTSPPAWSEGDPVPALPRDLDVTFGATLPVPGETVNFTFKMPDGTEESVTLTASTDPSDADSFQIGADANATATNFAAALGLAINKLATGKMVTASAYEAANNFFFGQGEDAMRIDVADRNNVAQLQAATSLVAGTNADTVLWYKGAESADSIAARRSVTARVGEGAEVSYGVEGNERGLVNLVRALGAMAIQSFPGSDPTSTDRYNAMTARNNAMLAEDTATQQGSIEMIAVELGLAKSTTGTVAERHTAHKAQLNNMLQDIEEAPTEVVAMEILALKTRLEASYQTTALLSQLALVNYLK